MPKRKARHGKPTASEFGQWRSYLARYGVTSTEINRALGAAVKGRTRDEIVQKLRQWLKKRPKRTAKIGRLNG